jgi:hypothetical protein
MRGLAFIFFSALSVVAQAQENLAEIVPNNQLQNLTATLETIANLNSPLDSSFEVQVLKEEEQGECGDDARSCPKSRIYIYISSHKTTTKQLICKLPEGYQWKFKEWLRVPDGNGIENFVSFALGVYYPSDEPKEGKWVTGRMIVEVNTDECIAYYV